MKQIARSSKQTDAEPDAACDDLEIDRSKQADSSAGVLIDADISSAETLPAEYYREATYLERARERVFARSWQFVGDTSMFAGGLKAVPITLLAGCLDEPLLLSLDDAGQVRCLSNVCTHRGNLLLEAPCLSETMRCRYHGRRFGIDGCYISAPGFEGAKNFPCTNDNLKSAQVGVWKNLIFVSIDPFCSFEDFVGEMQERLAWLPCDGMKWDRGLSRDYKIDANWALYVENYLEGLHVPYVHPALASTIDTNDYRYEVNRFNNLQIGIASHQEDAFDLPSDSSDYAQQIAAYYYWLFPNTMLNFYPWGLSINVVVPLSTDSTCVRYFTYVLDPDKLSRSSPESIEQTEREDQEIVQLVQRGMKSRLYRRGRYSPKWEPNVHHFHRLLLANLS